MLERPIQPIIPFSVLNLLQPLVIDFTDREGSGKGVKNSKKYVDLIYGMAAPLTAKSAAAASFHFPF